MDVDEDKKDISQLSKPLLETSYEEALQYAGSEPIRIMFGLKHDPHKKANEESSGAELDKTHPIYYLLKQARDSKTYVAPICGEIEFST